MTVEEPDLAITMFKKKKQNEEGAKGKNKRCLLDVFLIIWVQIHCLDLCIVPSAETLLVPKAKM